MMRTITGDGSHAGTGGLGTLVTALSAALAQAPAVTIHLDRAGGMYAPGEEVRATITVAARHDARVRAVTARLVRLDELDISPEALMAADELGATVSAVIATSAETWADGHALMQQDVLAAHSVRDFVCAWTLPGDADQARPDVVATRWLVRVDIDRPLLPDVHRAAELRIAAPPGSPS